MWWREARCCVWRVVCGCSWATAARQLPPPADVPRGTPCTRNRLLVTSVQLIAQSRHISHSLQSVSAGYPGRRRDTSRQRAVLLSFQGPQHPSTFPLTEIRRQFIEALQTNARSQAAAWSAGELRPRLGSPQNSIAGGFTAGGMQRNAVPCVECNGVAPGAGL